MLKILIVKEFLEHVMGFRFLIISVLCLAMVVTGIYILRADYLARLNDYEANTVMFREDTSKELSYRHLQLAGTFVDTRPAATQIPVYGLAKEHKTVHIGALKLPRFQTARSVNPIHIMFPVADLLFVVATIMSLLAFAMSFDAVSGERENGTLQLLMSYSVPRDLVILAKWIGGYMALTTPFILAALGGAVIIVSSSEIGFSVQDWLAYGLIVASSMLFMAVMFSIGILMSALFRESATAIAVLVFLWVTGVMISPNASPHLAELITPVKSSDAIENEVNETVAIQGRAIRKNFYDKKDAFLSEYKKMKKSKAKTNEELKLFQDTYAQMEIDLRLDFERIEKEVRNPHTKALHHQVNVARQVSRLSPVASFVYVSTDLAATGLQKHFDHLDAVRNYQETFREYVDDRIERRNKIWRETGEDPGYSIDNMPEFDYRPPSVRDRLLTNLVDMAALAIQAMIFFMASFLVFVRKDLLA
ncbi:ABC transporter permease subunit [Candidatus Hydrogenedentota bacterium]